MANEVKYFANFYKFTKNNTVLPISKEIEIDKKDIFSVRIPKNADIFTLFEKKKLTEFAYSSPLNIEYYCIGTVLSAQEAKEKFGELSSENNFIKENNLQKVLLFKNGTLATLMSKLGATCINKNLIDSNGYIVDNRDKDYLFLE